MTTLRRLASDELSDDERCQLRSLLDEAFAGTFSQHDWTNALGGTHVIVTEDGRVLSHASVVPRTLRVGSRALSTGYVEAVATRPDYRRRGHASRVLAEVGRVIGEQYRLGALSTGVPAIYERLGWERWAGPTFARTPTGVLRTADEDGGILVLRTATVGELDLRAPIVCDWREGDVW